MWLLLIVPWVGLHCVIVVFTDHTRFLEVDDSCCFLPLQNTFPEHLDRASPTKA